MSLLFVDVSWICYDLEVKAFPGQSLRVFALWFHKGLFQGAWLPDCSNRFIFLSVLKGFPLIKAESG